MSDDHCYDLAHGSPAESEKSDPSTSESIDTSSVCSVNGRNIASLNLSESDSKNYEFSLNSSYNVLDRSVFVNSSDISFTKVINTRDDYYDNVNCTEANKRKCILSEDCHSFINHCTEIDNDDFNVFIKKEPTMFIPTLSRTLDTQKNSKYVKRDPGNVKNKFLNNVSNSTLKKASKNGLRCLLVQESTLCHKSSAKKQMVVNLSKFIYF